MKTTKMWEDLNSDILERIASNNDIENFLRWPSIQTQMHSAACNQIQMESLKNNGTWDKWHQALKEDSFGNPILAQYHPSTSYASIYHAYSLSQIKPTGDVSDIKSIFEFGGGYGSMCKLIHRLGFKGTYTIYNLPALSQLQEIYLSKVGVKTDKITITNTLPKIDVELFIAEWSISESPIELRDDVFENIKFKECVISFHSLYGDFTNLEYFDKLAESMPNHDWKLQQIAHSPHNYFLTARSKNV